MGESRYYMIARFKTHEELEAAQEKYLMLIAPVLTNPRFDDRETPLADHKKSLDAENVILRWCPTSVEMNDNDYIQLQLHTPKEIWHFADLSTLANWFKKQGATVVKWNAEEDMLANVDWFYVLDKE